MFSLAMYDVDVDSIFDDTPDDISTKLEHLERGFTRSGILYKYRCDNCGKLYVSDDIHRCMRCKKIFRR